MRKRQWHEESKDELPCVALPCSPSGLGEQCTQVFNDALSENVLKYSQVEICNWL